MGYNYIRYAPPGAQILLTNPLFVRGHDFVGAQGGDHAWQPTSMYGSGWPSNAGGRLVGSLSALPYALAEAEKDFLVPSQTQALIWGDLVPQMILSATCADALGRGKYAACRGDDCGSGRESRCPCARDRGG